MISEQDLEVLKSNWLRVVDDVRQAESECGRKEGSVKIVGVSKYVDHEWTAALVAAGCQDLGENRPQVLWQKADVMPLSPQRWHLIGHLQTNKVRRVLRYQPLIHSVDSQRLLAAIADEVNKQNLSVESQSVESEFMAEVLLEVNVSGDAAKTGMPESELLQTLGSLPESGVEVRGLMAMAGYGSDAAEARKQFAAVRKLRDRVQDEFGLRLPELSMGMSGDFSEAIAEGATLVRIGSRIFEGLR